MITNVLEFIVRLIISIWLFGTFATTAWFVSYVYHAISLAITSGNTEAGVILACMSLASILLVCMCIKVRIQTGV